MTLISKFVALCSWKSINKGILVIAPESIVRISQCFLSVSLTFLYLHKTSAAPLTFVHGHDDTFNNHWSLVWCRSVRHPRRSNGEALLPKVHGCLHPQVLQTPPHRWSLFWDGVPPHAVHGAPRVSPEATSQPVCAKVCLTWCCYLLLALTHLYWCVLNTLPPKK